jgi:hypothetical protein
MRPKLVRWIIAGVLLAVACLGWRFRWPVYVNCVVGLTVTVYLAGIVRALVLEGRGRVTSLAFVLVGAIYLALVSGQLIRETLPTHYLLAIIWKYAWPAQVFIPNGTDEMVEMTNYDPGGMSEIFDTFRRAFEHQRYAERQAAFAFVAIGQCAFSWIFAALAGWIVGLAYDRRQRAAAEHR